MIFVYRAAIVAVATFVSALAGFGAHWVLPAAYVVESKGMVGSVVGLVASLLSLVLSLLIWTSHGLCTTQQSQLQTIGSSIIRLDFVLKAYGPEAERGRALLREHVKRIRARLWSNLDERRFIYHAIYHADVPEDVHRMIAFFVSLRPANDEQRQYLASARDILGTIVETQVTMISEPRQSGSVPVARRRSRMVVRVVLRLRSAIGCRRADDRPGRARSDLRRERGAPDPRTERPLLWPVQDAARRLRRTRPGPDKGRRDGGRRRDVGSKFGARVRQRFTAGY